VLGLIVASPVILAVAILVRCKLGRPIFFRQPRPGRDGRVFELVKFRTMRHAQDEMGRPLPDEQRLTPLGQVLRAWSFDELPELWNILKGDMSFVGPRPLLVEYLDRYSPRQARRHEVRPGLTGWAQVNGRNDTTWEDRLERDIWYVEHASFLLDLRILLLTLLLVFRRSGISHPNSATMPRFDGRRRSSE
jgi:lipopolysaccharide/colanic/teichoic acid biosynthesis glycosyltransferase